ncbi:MAG: aspartate--ammonia ligase [Spirochaetaceae bacterium]|nr:MAG: aspartate--ammonia ligase [Spirochaetaceae bacterium]
MQSPTNQLIVPAGYRPLMDARHTERAIQKIRDVFQTSLAYELNLVRVTAPLFVRSYTGINDDLNGVERPVRFPVGGLDNQEAEIVQSLAKWKRLTLADLGFQPGEGIYADMNAIRPDDAMDNTHSLYVDQWDWELTITPEDRTREFLVDTVRTVYDVIRRTERFICHEYDQLTPELPPAITIAHALDLARRYPELTPREREYKACREYGAVFIIGIGAPLDAGPPHDGRAPDYDDWTTETVPGYRGINGDILVYNRVLDAPLELSSMGIRVDPAALEHQLALTGTQDRRDLYFHRRLLAGELPASIGGGIGQSRLCMFYLRKAHIGEIQAGLWPDEMVARCREAGIPLL